MKKDFREEAYGNQRRRPPQQRDIKMKQRRRIRREALLFVIGLCSSAAPTVLGFASLDLNQLHQTTSIGTTTRRHATVENENRIGGSSNVPEDDEDNCSQEKLRNSAQGHRLRRSELRFSDKDMEMLSPSSFSSSDISTTKSEDEEEPLFARRMTAKIDSSSVEYNDGKHELLSSNARNGVSVKPSRKNGVATPTTNNNGFSEKQQSGYHTASAASPQPAPVVTSFQKDIRGRMKRERVELEDLHGELPGLLGIIEEMDNSLRRRVDATPASAIQPEKMENKQVNIQAEESTSNSNATSLLSSAGSLLTAAVSKVRNGWQRVTPFAFDGGTSHEDTPAANQTMSLSNATAEMTASDSTPKKKWSIQKAIVARMSHKKKRQLSNLMNKVNKRTTKNLGGITARTLSGLISAVAEEVDGLSVQLHAQEGTPFWRKQIDSVTIEFTRLGFKPLHMGGPDQMLQHSKADKELEKERAQKIKQQQEQLRKEIEERKVSLKDADEDDEKEDECPVEYATDENGNTIATMSCADTAFQQIDVDNSGALDKDEIADALVLAATSMEAKQSGANNIPGVVADIGASSRKVIQGLAKQLVDLYDTNNGKG